MKHMPWINLTLRRGALPKPVQHAMMAKLTEVLMWWEKVAAILNMVATCVRLPECNEGRIFYNFAVAGHRYFNNLEEMPVFTSRNFYNVCATVCTTKSYVAKQARSILCGY
jgi:hypothetical protein